MPKHIVVVEDHPDLLQMLTKLLKKEGYLVTAVTDGQAAIVAVHRDRPDAIILDINIPVLDGFQVTAQLKENPLTKNIPIVIVTAAFDTPEAVKKGLDLGAAGYVIKPFMHLPFLFTIRRILGDLPSASTEGEKP
ncbi:MAG: response regulator [Deltaproteobacteria bacterium]|nr:response regulator [Deltaproteobacteria bacterium]